MIQHPELDGPFSVPMAWTTQTIDGQPFQVPTAFADNRWNTTTGFYTTHVELLEPYHVAPSAFSRVWSGDDPLAPTITVALAFPDAASAIAIFAACGVTDLPVSQ